MNDFRHGKHSSSGVLDTFEDSDEERLWYVCVGCNRAFEKDFQLRIHRKEVHGKQGQARKKVMSAFILSRDDLLPKIEVKCCTRFPPESSSSAREDTASARLVEVTGGLTDQISNSNNKSFHHHHLLIKTKLMQPIIKLVKVSVKSKRVKYKNRSVLSSVGQSSARKSKKSAADYRDESPKYFSSIVVNRSLNTVKSESTETGYPAVLEPCIQCEKVVIEAQLPQPPTPTDHSEGTPTQCLQNNETDNGISNDDIESSIHVRQQALDPPECMEYERPSSSSPDNAFNTSSPNVCVDGLKTEIGDAHQESDSGIIEPSSSPGLTGTEIDSQIEKLSTPPKSTQRSTEIRSAESPEKVVEGSDQHQNLLDVNLTGDAVQDQVDSFGEMFQPSKETESPVPLEQEVAHNYADQRGTKVRPFKCGWPDCGKTYTRQHHLRDHKRNVHKMSFPVSIKAAGIENGTNNPVVLTVAVEELENVRVHCGDQLSKNDKNSDNHRTGSTRKAKLHARACISKSLSLKSVYAESESETEEAVADEETDVYFNTSASSFSDENEVNNDEGESPTENAITEPKLTQLSHKVLLTSDDGSKEIYLECEICEYRHENQTSMQMHIRRTHTKLQINKALKIWGVPLPKEIEEDSSKRCSTETEATNLKTCQHCGVTYSTIWSMNKHINLMHSNMKKMSEPQPGTTANEIVNGSPKASCSKSEYSVESASASKGKRGDGDDDETDMELSSDSSLSSEDEDELDNEESEVEVEVESTATQNAIRKLVESSDQILLKLPEGKEERYLECRLCHCRYMTPKCLERHINEYHAKLLEVNKTLEILREAQECERQEEGSTKGCCTETSNPKTVRTCKDCGAIRSTLHQLNTHIIKNHLIAKQMTPGSVAKLANASNRILLKYLNNPKQNNTLFECKICPCKFLIVASLLKHIKNIHSKEEIDEALSKLAADETNEEDGDSRNDNKCTEVTNSEEIRRCKFCGAVMGTLSTFNSHIIQVHLKKQRVKCSICDNDFVTKKCLEDHEVKIHGLGKPNKFLCSTCGSTFSTKLYLSNHILKAHGVYSSTVSELKCKVCQRPCSTKRNLGMHMLTHSEGTLLCTICGKKFRQEHNYQNHMRRHGDERSYKCKQCPATFKVPYLLLRHTRREHEGRTYDCGKCGKKFNDPNKRDLHIKKVHFGEIYKCDVCEKVLGDPTALKLHKRRFHDPNFKRNFECDICKKVFMFPSLLANHKKAAHGDGGQVEKKFQCEECGKKFKFLCHLKTHSTSHRRSKSEKRQDSNSLSESEDDTSGENYF